MKIEDLYKIMNNFRQELQSFQQDFLSFRYEMNEFRKETRDELSKQSQTLIGIENTLNFYAICTK